MTYIYIYDIYIYIYIYIIRTHHISKGAALCAASCRPSIWRSPADLLNKYIYIYIYIHTHYFNTYLLLLVCSFFWRSPADAQLLLTTRLLSISALTPSTDTSPCMQNFRFTLGPRPGTCRSRPRGSAPRSRRPRRAGAGPAGQCRRALFHVFFRRVEGHNLTFFALFAASEEGTRQTRSVRRAFPLEARTSTHLRETKGVSRKGV